MGSPTVVADINSVGPTSQIAARLLDVDTASGDATLVARGLYRPEINTGRRRRRARSSSSIRTDGSSRRATSRSWSCSPNDTPYGRVSNGQAPVTVSNLELRLPVLEGPGDLGGGIVLAAAGPEGPPRRLRARGRLPGAAPGATTARRPTPSAGATQTGPKREAGSTRKRPARRAPSAQQAGEGREEEAPAQGQEEEEARKKRAARARGPARRRRRPSGFPTPRPAVHSRSPAARASATSSERASARKRSRSSPKRSARSHRCGSSTLPRSAKSESHISQKRPCRPAASAAACSAGERGCFEAIGKWRKHRRHSRSRRPGHIAAQLGQPRSM